MPYLVSAGVSSTKAAAWTNGSIHTVCLGLLVSTLVFSRWHPAPTANLCPFSGRTQLILELWAVLAGRWKDIY